MVDHSYEFTPAIILFIWAVMGMGLSLWVRLDKGAGAIMGRIFACVVSLLYACFFGFFVDHDLYYFYIPMFLFTIFFTNKYLEKEKQLKKNSNQSTLSSEINKTDIKDIKPITKSKLVETPKIKATQKKYNHYDINDYKENTSIIGKTVKFTYEDSEGNITSRTVDVSIVTDFYIKGYCHKRRAERTFRIDRIIGDIELGSKRIDPNNLANKTKRKQTTKSYDYEVCFTGFKKATKEQLETLARIKGFLVRKSVTNNLNFLVTGDNAGFSKVAKAESMGITILTEEEFRNLLETGELPS